MMANFWQLDTILQNTNIPLEYDDFLHNFVSQS